MELTHTHTLTTSVSYLSFTNCSLHTSGGTGDHKRWCSQIKLSQKRFSLVSVKFLRADRLSVKKLLITVNLHAVPPPLCTCFHTFPCIIHQDFQRRIGTSKGSSDFHEVLIYQILTVRAFFKSFKAALKIP